IDEAKKLFQKIITSKISIDPDIRGVVYNIVARNGDKKECGTFLELYKKEEVQQEKDKLARALTLFQQKELLKRVLDFSISDDVRKQDSFRFVNGVIMNQKGREITWEFIKDNYSLLKKRYENA